MRGIKDKAIHILPTVLKVVHSHLCGAVLIIEPIGQNGTHHGGAHHAELSTFNI